MREWIVMARENVPYKFHVIARYVSNIFSIVCGPDTLKLYFIFRFDLNLTLQFTVKVKVEYHRTVLFLRFQALIQVHLFNLPPQSLHGLYNITRNEIIGPTTIGITNTLGINKHNIKLDRKSFEENLRRRHVADL